MPLGKNVRYRFKNVGKNKAVRFAFRGNRVIEVSSFRRSKRGKLEKVKTHQRTLGRWRDMARFGRRLTAKHYKKTAAQRKKYGR